MGWRLKRTKQCRKCPWLIGVNPRDIPNGYCEIKHDQLRSTIADPTDTMGQLGKTSLHVMACHETDSAHCLGWLVNQLGPGNNIGLRIKMLTCENRDKIELRGEQYQHFKDTLPEL
jgi:hypothetical protein